MTNPLAVEGWEDPLERIRRLQERLEEAEETLRALRNGEVDAIVASGPDGDSVYTLRGADEAYRVMVQGMAEGALTLGADGLILFANEQFAALVGSALEQVIGGRIQDFVCAEDVGLISALLNARRGKAEIRLRKGNGSLVPVYLSVQNLELDGAECLCLMVTDLSEQKRNREMVAAERLARSILEQAAEAILVVDPGGRIDRTSRAAERLAGAPILQQTFDEIFQITVDGKELVFREILSAAGAGHALQDVEAKAVLSDGREIDLLLSAAIVSGPGSEPLGCVIHLTDITERKRKERQLKFQADILETTSAAVIAFGRDHRVSFWNHGAEQLYGVPAGAALGKLSSELHYPLWVNPDDKEHALAALEQEGTWSGENIHDRSDGRRIHVSLTVNRTGEEHGGGMFAVVRDITKSKQAEAILRESETRERRRSAESKAIMEAVPAAVFIARDRAGIDMVGNRMCYELLRVPQGANVSKSAPEAVRPQNFRMMKNGREIAAEDLPVQLAARTGRAVYNYEFDVVFDDGDTRYWLGNAVPLLDDAGQPVGAVGAFVDMTERKRAEEHLQQAQKLETLGVLAGGIAHDFNNLLVGVMGNASMVQEMLPQEDPAAVFLERIVKASDQLAHLTGQMLAYAGKGRFLVEQLHLPELIPEMTALIQPSIPNRTALEFEFDRTAALPLIEADRGQLQQVFMNLVLNAAEAVGSENGVISIRTGVREVDAKFIRRNPDAAGLSAGSYVYLEVSDNGCGMDAATRAKIFDPFFSTKFLGRGLGLAAVHGIVRSHKGAVLVNSEPGQGSTFSVLFPAVERKAAVRQGMEERGADAQVTILVVDDDEGVRELASHGLGYRGYEVLLAKDGIEALEVLRLHPGEIALIVLDLSMPKMSGEEALPEIRKVRPEVEVIISSGYNESETMALFKDQQVSGFIQKPYTLRKLAEKIQAALR